MTIRAMYSDLWSLMNCKPNCNPYNISSTGNPIKFLSTPWKAPKLNLSGGGVSFGKFSFGRSCSTLFGRSCLYPQNFGNIIFNYCHLYNVKSSTKWENIETFWIIALHLYPISMDYKIVFQKLPKTYASRKYGMGKLCPCCYFEKSLKVKELPSLRFITYTSM